MEKLVSVIIPVSGSKYYEFGKYAINSILNQTYKNIEIIVVTDSDKWLIGYGKEIRIIIDDGYENGKYHVSISRNIGINASKGYYIAFLDSDDYFHSDKIRAQVERLKQYPDYGLTYTYIVRVNKEHKIIRLDKICPFVKKMAKYWLKKRFIALSSIMITKETCILFDCAMTHAEDFDFLLRLRHIKWIETAEYLTYYTIHEDNKSKQENHKHMVDYALKKNGIKKR